ncbi:MAG: type II toxin-antitoxin system Phd/YefM family antitoxin [Cyanobacteria bacterium J06623_4]
MLVSKTESASQARQEFFKILDEVAQDSSVIIIKRKDAPNAAIIAESELNNLIETVHLLRSPQNAKRLFSALEKSRTRDLNLPIEGNIDVAKSLEDLRQYCEQKEEENTVEACLTEDIVTPTEISNI